MSDSAVQPAAQATPGLSQGQRFTNTFTAPSKTFNDIKLGNKSWWLPFIIMVLFGYIFFAAITTKVGWTQVAQNTIHMSPKAEEQMSQLPKDQQDMRMKFTAYAMEGSFAALPVSRSMVSRLTARSGYTRPHGRTRRRSVPSFRKTWPRSQRVKSKLGRRTTYSSSSISVRS